ncbi:MAG: hypothetical protein QXL10_01970 [Candidatus Bathyarchaeia archaeon]
MVEARGEVAICIEMSAYCMRVCKTGIKVQYPCISEGKKGARAILAFSRVDLTAVRRRVRGDGRLAMLEGLMENLR